MKKQDIIDQLIKNGNNQDWAKEAVEVNFAYLVRIYPAATVKEAADVIRTIA